MQQKQIQRADKQDSQGYKYKVGNIAMTSNEELKRNRQVRS